jgi:hypothetical protein
MKAGCIPPVAADSQNQQTLPPGFLEALISGGGSGSQGQGGDGAGGGGFNFDSIMMESVNLTSLLGAVVNSYSEGGIGRDGANENSGNGNSGRSNVAMKAATKQTQEQLLHHQEPLPQQQSRFSQFFNKSLPEAAAAAPGPAAGGAQQKPHSSRRSSIQDELLGSNILREINGEATIRIPSPEEEGGGSSKYFTPISPAAKTAGPPQG